MLFLDGVYVARPDGRLRFRWVKAPTTVELTQLADTIARRVGRGLERQGLLERDAENSWLTGDACGDAVKIVAAIEDPVVIKKIPDHLEGQGAMPQAYHRSAVRAPPKMKQEMVLNRP